MTVLNSKGKPFSWSYSSLTDYEGCPARYAAKRFYCTTTEEPTIHTIWGERVHKAFEVRVRDDVPFSEDFPVAYEKWANVLSALPGKKFFERKLAVDKRWEPCEFFAPEAKGRGIVDLLVVENDVASVVDYKTGKVKNDETQLKLFCWFVSNEHPEVKTFKYRYIWLAPGTVTGGEIKRESLMETEVDIRHRVAAMERAWDEQNFPCFPSGLCNGWCPVEECIHFKRRKEWK